MSSTPVRIGRGYLDIDPAAWIDRRVGDCVAEATTALHEYLRHPIFNTPRVALDRTERVLLWCAARQWQVTDGHVIHHDESTGLTEPMSVVLADAADLGALAIIEYGQRWPTVYRDVTTDPGHWLTVATVSLTCPSGHLWEWSDGHITEIGATIGAQQRWPMAPCRECAPSEVETSQADCPDSGGWAIYCPRCDGRCRVDTAEVPTLNPKLWAL
ncbi:hypothetical protein [Catellatospora chokoriensis]|uniref:Uncharacterized protein n=1 Tax=Catellatospora chokoriensis TaxID=310353 RepID=A0A8J3NR42_9ACTN|nr:hypothetical protein [Catellatospora chokoriensis]GIF89817.1 hypothetical protein Cch02nite_32610 [Catellatospora chokoriensis]